MLAILAVAAMQFQCGPSPDVLNALASKYEERIAWTGTGKSGKFVLLESRKGTWTLLLMPSPDVACGVGSGVKSKPIFGEPT